MKNYVKIARPDHWIKNFFIMPGVAIAFLLTEHSIRDINIHKLICAFFATCMIASANYVINEWLDAPFDKFHPTKKNRPVVAENMKFSIVIAEYIALIIVGVILSLLVNNPFLITSLILLFMGFLYNVKPFRTKDIAYFDVLSESINNMLRLMMGWFVVTDSSLPPSSILIGYWMSGAFLMATKRFAEYRMIGNPETAGLYRRSFNYYSEKTLLASALFYSLVSTFCLGVFLIKYRIEYLLCMPLVFLLFSYYVAMAFDPDSAVQRPEKLFKEKTLMFMVFIIIIAFTALTFVNVDFLHSLTSNELIWVRSH
jgi:4-hydroxybenzoate polyprenyltransferase